MGENNSRGSLALADLMYAAGWSITQRLPERVAAAMFERIADYASKNGRGPEQLRRNLERVVPPGECTDELVRDAMRSYLRYWREAFRLPTMIRNREELVARVDAGFDPDSRRRVAETVARGRGTIFALPHAGNWDMAGVWLVAKYGTFTTVAERLRPESLFHRFVAFREGLGFRVLAHEGRAGSAGPALMADLEAVLRSGGVVCLLGERDLTGRGVPVTFFGETTSMPAGPAALAQRTGADLMVAGVSFTDLTDGDETSVYYRGKKRRYREGWRMRVSAPIDTDPARPLADVVQDLAAEFERDIAAHPRDWHMLQPLWLTDVARRKERTQRKGQQ